MNLFVIYIGGAHEGSMIELHDMRFVVAENIEDTYSYLKKSWWGIPESLHLDAWGSLRYADGYEIYLKNKPPLGTKNKLYFVNLGGYSSSEFTELHKNIFMVAENEIDAKARALTQIQNWTTPHRDYQFDVEKIISIDDILFEQNNYLHLVPSSKNQEFEFMCQYVPIGKN